MTLKTCISILVLMTSFYVRPQADVYSYLTLDPELKKNANAVLRAEDSRFEMSSIKSMKRTYKRVVTVLNRKGNRHLHTAVGYDDGIHVKKLYAVVYDQLGNEVRKYKKSDFKDVAAVSSISLYEDSRVKYLDYTPVNYPYTMEFYYETESANTAHIPFWKPLEGYYISTQNSSFTVVHDPSIEMGLKEKNFDDLDITGEITKGVIRYEANNLMALKREELSPVFRQFGPQLLVSPKTFHYEGHMGSAEDWESLGKWIHDNLLEGRTNLSPATQNEVLQLVQGVDDPIEKAKLVYQYVQDNTRYISVQVGIGGIQPIPANEVDKVKYGDCKGLTNYTKALLDVVGVKSYYTEVYAGPEIQYNVDPEHFSLMGQGNHVILNIPTENDESIWLECTSQIMPFGFLGDFTDNRDVFVITPEGGRVVKTPKYEAEQNTQHTTGTIQLSESGSITVDTEVVSVGIQYDDRFYIENEELLEQKKHYKEYWDNINNIEFESISHVNDRDSITFTERVKFSAMNYCSSIGDKMLFVPNALNKYNSVPDRYRNRKLPLSLLRGFVDTDAYEIHLPTGYAVEFIPEPITVENKFGTYEVAIEQTSASTLMYKRTFMLTDGQYPKEDYNPFRNFMRQVAKHDNAKIILIKQ